DGPDVRDGNASDHRVRTYPWPRFRFVMGRSKVPGVRALRRFTVRAALPEPLLPLGDLVLNLRWSWHPESLDLFESVDPDTWDAVGHDPVRLLGEVGSDRMAALAKDRRFLRRLQGAWDDLQD